MQNIAQLIEEKAIQGAIRTAPAPGSHTLAVARDAARARVREPLYALHWWWPAQPKQGGQQIVSRDEALQLISMGAADEAGLTS